MLVLVLFATNIQAGVVIGGTRVIYPAGKKTVSLTVMNDKTSGVYLVQSWIESNVAGQPSPFIITPPLFRMNSGEENLLRIVFVGGQLPQDRESVFWLNVKSIPAIDDSVVTENTLQMVVRSRIKLFYRPEKLPGTPEMGWKNLEIHQEGDQLVIKNPGACYVSLYSLTIDGKEYDDVNMVPPKSQIVLIAKKVSQVTWRAINDYGGITPAIHRQLQE
ncbi:TPA: molecular chaperone [Salmonella enterica subsp. salamae serovar 28:r:e,n,z15]|nr:molecular chaperone [Salmonella enterica subsp. salamae serovar 28:r:e,n,z15]